MAGEDELVPAVGPEKGKAMKTFIILLAALLLVGGCQTTRQRQKMIQEQKKHDGLAGGNHGWYIMAEPEEVADE